MKKKKEDFTDATCYKITKDILSVFLIPLSIGFISYFITKSIAKADRRLSITEIVVDKVGGDQLDRDFALEMVSLVDDDYSKQLKEIVNVQVIKRYVADFSSGEAHVRGNAVRNLIELHKTYPEAVISEILNIVDEESENMGWPKTISITQTLFNIGEWKGTFEQKEKLESLKSNKFYNDTSKNVKKYLDGALSNLKNK